MTAAREVLTSARLCTANSSKRSNLISIYDSRQKKVRSSLHTAAVSADICNAGPNKLLGEYPPCINKSEETLPRSHRVALAQLRSSYCARLRSYQHSIGRADDAICPECGAFSQTPSHLFNCPRFPTDLTKKDLWSNPREAAVYVSNLPSFIRTLPPVPPVPPHPGQPP
jgi:hypothetical protein